MVEHLLDLEAKAQSLKNEYLRLLADFDNFRKRIEREMEIRQVAEVAKLLSDLLPVLDNFGRALSATAQLPRETVRNGTNADNSKERGAENGIMKGIDLIYKELCAVLAKHGLKEFSCLGEEFDPKVAEAVGFVQKNKESENRVVEELCRGYEYRGRVLRPARVVVAKTINSEDKADSARIADEEKV